MNSPLVVQFHRRRRQRPRPRTRNNNNNTPDRGSVVVDVAGCWPWSRRPQNRRRRRPSLWQRQFVMDDNDSDDDDDQHSFQAHRYDDDDGDGEDSCCGEEEEKVAVVVEHQEPGVESLSCGDDAMAERSRLATTTTTPTLPGNGDPLPAASNSSSAAESISFIRSHHENYPDAVGFSSGDDSDSDDEHSFAVQVVNDHDDDDDDDGYDSYSADSYRSTVHPLVEQAIRDGVDRRYSRNTYCLKGDFCLSEADMVAIINFLTDLPNAVTRLVFLQTQFSLAAMKVWTSQFLTLPDCRIERLMLSGVMLLPSNNNQNNNNDEIRHSDDDDDNDDDSQEILTLFLQALADNESIVELVIHDTYDLNVIDARVGAALARALSASPQLKSLTLRGMGGFSQGGLYHLSRNHSHHTLPLRLRLGGNNNNTIVHNNWTSSPSSLQHLTELCLRDCQLDCSKIAVLFRGILGEPEEEEECLDRKLPATSKRHNAVATTSALQSLDLSNNHLRAASLKWFAKFLLLQQQGERRRASPQLPWIESQAMVQPCTKETGLQSLSLTGNKNLFDNATAETQQLAGALAVNTSLKRLVMERCGLNGHTASLLFQALETNQTLQELNIRINSGIGSASTSVVVAAPASRDLPASSSPNNSNDTIPLSKITSYYSHMIQSLPRLAGLQSLAFDALFPQLDQSVLLKALEQNITLTNMVAHYGLDHAVQNQVNAILRRNQLYQKMHSLLMGTLATENSTATTTTTAMSATSVATTMAVPLEPPKQQQQHQVSTPPLKLQYSRGLIAPCLSQWVNEMKHPRSEEHEQVGNTVLFNTLRKYQPWGR